MPGTGYLGRRYFSRRFKAKYPPKTMNATVMKDTDPKLRSEMTFGSRPPQNTSTLFIAAEKL